MWSLFPSVFAEVGSLGLGLAQLPRTDPFLIFSDKETGLKE